MKSISCIYIIFIGLSVCNAFGKVEYLPLPQNQSVDEITKSETEFFQKTRFLSVFNKLPLRFVANQGQLDPSVVYYAKSDGTTVYCTEQGLVFGFAEGSISLKFSEDRRVKPEARGELEGKVNYFIGNEPALWQTDISTFSEVVYRDVYPGIDLVYSGNQRRLKYTFYLQPHAEADQILMIYDGIESVSVDDATGELIIQTRWGEMRDAAPVAYQEIDGVRKDIDISFRLLGEKRVSFAMGDYDPNFMLVLDPGYSTYLGGSESETGYDIAVDSSGNAYVTGNTNSSDFPTQNAYDSSLGGANDTFVTKIDTTQSGNDSLVYSTYFGGSSEDVSSSIAIDSSRNAYVAGTTNSSDFPTQSAYDSSYGGSWDAFVAKLSSSGNTLIYSTYLGSGSDDRGRGIAVDSSGNAYVAGTTNSSDFPTQNAYQGSKAGDYDTFVTKIDTTQSGNDSLVYSTYLGGSGYEDSERHGIAVDSSGSAYVTGTTHSSDFPTQNAYQGSHGGGIRDVFVAKLSSSGSTLIYSTYLGGSNDDGSIGIAVNSDGNAYVTGYTNSSGFPTQNPYDSSLGGNRDAFVASYLQDGSLPVELSLLTATASADGVIIRWRTESEVNNIGFVIYRSEKKDGNYTKIAFISGASNSAMPIDYQFTDKKVEAGKTYFYYLEDIDIAGEKNRLKIIRVVVPTAKSVLLVPKEFRLLQNYPNPFNPDTWLPYELAADATVTIRIYDVNGQLVRQLDLGVQKAGRYVDKEKAAYWDGKDQTGKTVSSGLYFYTLKAGDFQATRRMVIVK